METQSLDQWFTDFSCGEIRMGKLSEQPYPVPKDWLFVGNYEDVKKEFDWRCKASKFREDARELRKKRKLYSWSGEYVKLLAAYLMPDNSIEVNLLVLKKVPYDDDYKSIEMTEAEYWELVNNPFEMTEAEYWELKNIKYC